MKCSIFIPTKNAGNNFNNVLNQISIQKEKFELIIVDSGSTDNTLNIINNWKDKIPIKLYQISPKEFGHGKTRNLASKYASGEFIIFLSQDAIPQNNLWISNLIRNFKDKNIAASFSKQIPGENANEIERFFCKENYPNKKIVRPFNNEDSLENIFFSNVSSCLSKKILREFPFNESIIMSEDQEWTRKIIRKGYKTVYDPESIVIHSHNYNLRQTFQRYFDSALSLKQIFGKFNNFTKKGSRYMRKEFSYILKTKPLLAIYLIPYNLTKIIATTLGINHPKLSKNIKRKLSMHKNYWN